MTTPTDCKTHTCKWMPKYGCIETNDDGQWWLDNEAIGYDSEWPIRHCPWCGQRLYSEGEKK